MRSITFGVHLITLKTHAVLGSASEGTSEQSFGKFYIAVQDQHGVNVSSSALMCPSN